MTLTEKIEKILEPAINVRAPYARAMITELTLLIATHEPSEKAAAEADRELLAFLQQQIKDKLFTGMASLTIEGCGQRYKKADANTGRVRLANFITNAEQDQALNDTFEQEAVAARPYVYTLERELIKRLTTEVLR